MKNRKGIVMMLMGLLLMLAALFYTFSNFETEREAGETAYSALTVIEQAIQQNRLDAAATVAPPEGPAAAQQVNGTQSGTGDQPDVLPTSAQTASAQQPSDAAPTLAPTTVVQLPEVPDYVQFPDMEMPEVEVDGQMYIGVLTIPAIELQLPVISQWSLPKLKIAPARYMGSAYQDNLILLAHNYSTHFGTLRDLTMGDQVLFTDMAGNVFEYTVAEMETLRPNESRKMIESDYPLTLFTCTPGGQMRLTVRCDRVEQTQYVNYSN